MSTLTSKDLHLKRSSTRLHAPPGGKSSFSFSDGSDDRQRFASKEPAQSTYGKAVAPTYNYPPSAPKGYSGGSQAQVSRYASVPMNTYNSMSSAAPSETMDPKLLAYMETLSPNEKAVFEQMVSEEMDKLSSNFKSSATIDSERNNYNPSKNEQYNDKSSSNLNYSASKSSEGMSMMSTGCTPLGRVDERQYAKDKQTQYRNQLDEAASRPAIADQRVSLHSQRQMKQQNDNNPQYSIGNSDNSVLSIGAKKVGYSGSPRGYSDPGRNEEYNKKKMAQEAYSKQLTADMDNKPSQGSNRGSSRELQQRLVESNYVSSSRTDLFGGMGSNVSSQHEKQSKYAHDLAMDAKRNKEAQGVSDRNQYIPPTSSKPNSSYNNGSNYASDSYQVRDSYAPSANYNTSSNSFSAGGGSDGRVKEYDAYNIPGLSGGDNYSKPKGSSPLSSFVASQSKGAPSNGYSGNDYNYAAQSPIYTSKAKSASTPYQQQSMQMDSIDRQLVNPQNGGYAGGANAATPQQYSNGGNYGYGGNNSGPINGGNPIKSPSVGRGRSSGGGQSSIQLF